MSDAGTIYASELVIEAVGLTPCGVPWAGLSTCCAACGKPIEPGDIAVSDKARFKATFMEGPSLAARGSGAVCGACSALMNAKPFTALQRHVITRAGAFPIGKDLNRAWFLLEPPAPPWVAIVGGANATHMIWRTPVTLDNNLMVIRLGATLLRIRRPMLFQAMSDCQSLCDYVRGRLSELGRKGTLKAETRHPFVSLDRDMKDPKLGQIRGDVLIMVHEPSCPTHIKQMLARLHALSTGELWALATLMKATPDEPQKPQPLTLSDVS